MKTLPTISILLLSLLFAVHGAQANTVASSTMYFQGALTDNGDGTYSGIVAMIDEGGGDSGYDVYGEEGANAWFGNDPGSGPVWTSQAIGADHDAWPTWTPDTPDWYQYSLTLYVDGGQQKWAVRNHPGATAANPWDDTAFWGGSGKPPAGVPMSGSMLWYSNGTGGYAEETDTGAYLPATGTPEIPGGAAGQGGGAHAWDMDWSWGSEVVPLEFPGFEVSVTDLGGGSYDVTLTPAVHQNTIPSSTMYFEGPLTDGGGGIYTGTIPMTGGGFYAAGGFDVYADEGGTAYVTGSTWPIGSSHDAYSAAGPWGSWWDPDVPDWNQYSLELTADHWYLRYTSTGESPMSGLMGWAIMHAAETDLGTQDGGHGGSAAQGGGPEAWDWDCGWGVEVIPLELSTFSVEVTDLGGGQYRVALTPSLLPPPTEVWVDDDYCDACANDGNLWGYNAFDNIQEAIDAVGANGSAAMQSGADRLVDLQNDDGGWDWPLDDGDPASASPLNTVGPIAMGLAQAYLHTGNPTHLAALKNAGAFLLTKTNNFSPSDGYLAAMLDQVFGVTTYTDHITANFYDQLAAGTYDRNGEGTLYDTASYVQKIRNDRFNQGIGNLAAWDVGMGLVGAASAGASTAEWIAGVKNEIDELDGSAYYDVIGLAGAVYGLAFVGEDFDPTSGEHSSAGSISDLAAILAAYQIDGGGFSWSSLYLNPGNDDETIQETAYATLALNEVDRDGYLNEIRGAANYIRNVQMATGGWKNWAGGDENNEITGEALWAHSIVYPATPNIVHVAAGTYAGTVNIDGINNITITGADKNTVIIQPSSVLDQDGCGHTSDRKAVFRVVNSTDVALQNMTMDFDLVKANGVTGIFYCNSTGTLHNNNIQNMWLPDLSGAYYEIGSDFTAPGYSDTSRADITISDNIFKDMGRLGTVTHWYVEATITGNTFYNTESDFGYGVEIGGPSTGTISGNTFYGFDTPALSDNSESAGIYIENAFTSSLAGITKDVLVENNEIYNSQYGMWIGNGYDGFAGDVDINVMLNGNDFHDNVDGGAWIQDEDKADGSSVTVTGSGNSWTDNGLYGLRIYTEGDGNITVDLTWETISGNDVGISVEDSAGVSSNSSYSVSVNQSDIFDNTDYGVENTVDTFIVDAKYNWWGDMSGPYDSAGSDETDGETCYDPSTMLNADGTGNDVSDLYVDYCPWHTYQNPDVDGDGICNPYVIDPSCAGSDNCPVTPNAGQEDTYPPGGNGIGDACECEADFDCDGDVDGSDATTFKLYFGRNTLFYPCDEINPCRGDFDCDGDVDGTDASLFKADFGRSVYKDPCPLCTVGDWCSYQ